MTAWLTSGYFRLFFVFKDWVEGVSYSVPVETGLLGTFGCYLFNPDFFQRSDKQSSFQLVIGKLALLTPFWYLAWSVQTSPKQYSLSFSFNNTIKVSALRIQGLHLICSLLLPEMLEYSLAHDIVASHQFEALTTFLSINHTVCATYKSSVVQIRVASRRITISLLSRMYWLNICCRWWLQIQKIK